MIQFRIPGVVPDCACCIRRVGEAVTDQLEEAVLKLMHLARAALDQGDIDTASRLLRLAALASEDRNVLQHVTGLPDALLVGMTADGPESKPN